MADYSLRPRLEEALSQGRIPALSREEALTLDQDYRTKVGETVIGLAIRNLKISIKGKYELSYRGRPYFPGDEYNCLLDNDPEKGCLPELPKELQKKFYSGLFVYHFRVDREKLRSNKRFKIPFSSVNVLEGLFVEKGYSRDEETEKTNEQLVKEGQKVLYDNLALSFISPKIKKSLEQEINAQCKTLEQRARILFEDNSIRFENVEDLKGFSWMNEWRIYSNGKSNLFLGSSYHGSHLVYYDKTMRGNVGEVPNFLESVRNPEGDLKGIQRFVYDWGQAIPYAGYTLATIGLLSSFPALRKDSIWMFLSFLPVSILSNFLIGPKIRKSVINRQKQKLRQNPDFKLDEDAIKYLVEK